MHALVGEVGVEGSSWAHIASPVLLERSRLGADGASVSLDAVDHASGA